MPSSYLAAYPQTVISIVKTGKLPDSLPSWLKINNFFCTRNISDCLSNIKAAPDQTFILEIDFPKNRNSLQFIHDSLDDDLNGFIITTHINPDWIQRIIVYSQKSYRLLNKLFSHHCQKPIIVQPTNNDSKMEIETSSSQTSKKRALNFFERDVEIVESNKRARVKEIELKEEKTSLHRLDRLTTYDQHLSLLESAFRQAKKSILITTYNITQETLKRANLYKLIPDALRRGVSIYIYINDKNDLDEQVETFLDDFDIFCEETYTHSKILAVDHQFVATGSFNWLAINSQYAPSEEGSLVYYGPSSNLLIQEFWKHIKYYRNLQFLNDDQLDEFEDNPANQRAISYSIEQDSRLTYLPTLEQHCTFLSESFSKTQQRLVICSPFISSSGNFELDINYRTLQNAIRREIEIYFVCSLESKNFLDFKNFLRKLNYSRLHLIPMRDIHLKTIIIDDHTIAEGSFNWLSAAREEDNPSHNHEVTLVVQGNMARKLIEQFYQSKVGKALLTNICSQDDKYSLRRP